MKVVGTVRKQCELQAGLMRVIEEITYRSLCLVDMNVWMKDLYLRRRQGRAVSGNGWSAARNEWIAQCN